MAATTKAQLQAQLDKLQRSRARAKARSAGQKKALAEALARQQATAEILEVIRRSPTDAQPVFEAIARSAVGLCDGVMGGVFRFDGVLVHPGAMVNFAHGGGEAWRRLYPRPPSPDTASGRAILERAVAIVPDVEADPGRAEWAREVARIGGYRSAIAAPMLRDGQPIGVILVCRREPGTFPDNQVALLQNFADQAVIAIENARLFNETRDALERQTATAEILKVIASSPSDTAPVFEAIVQGALRVFDGMGVAIGLADGDEFDVSAIGGVGSFAKRRHPLDRESVSSTAVLDQRVVNLRDTEAPDAPRLARENGRAAGFRSMAAAPMMLKGKAIGSIAVLRRDPGGMSDKQLELLETFADQAVIAIANVRAFNETREALERQTATAEILEVISSSPTEIQPVLDAVAATAARLCEATDAIVQVRVGEVLRFVAHHGAMPNLPVGATRPISRELVTGRSVVEGRQIHVHDLQSETREYPQGSAIAKQFGYRTILATPLMREGAAIGTIMIRRTEARPFTDAHLALMRTFADQAVIAIENVRLFNETKEALERQTATAEILKVISSSPTDVQPVFDAIAKSAIRLIGGHSCSVTRVLGERLHIASLTSTDPSADDLVRSNYPMLLTEQTPIAEAVRSGRTLIVSDTETDPRYDGIGRQVARSRGFRAIAYVPMRGQQAVLGVIHAARSEPSSITDQHVNLLESFADQAVIAIENVRLFNETKEALERQTATAEILKVIAGSPSDVQPVFDAIVGSVARLFGRKAALRTLDADGLRRRARSYEPDPGEYHGRDVEPLDRASIVGQAVLEGRALQWRDTLVEGAATYGLEEARKLAFRSIASAPLMCKGTAIGVISVSSPVPGALTDKQMELLATFADQAVIAIENTRLFNETREALERQTATAEILKVISESPTDVQPVFDAIVQSGLRLFDGQGVGIVLVDGERLQLGSAGGVISLEEARKRYPIPLDRDTIAGRAILDRTPVNIPDVQAPDVPRTAKMIGRELGYRAIAAVPMLRKGVATGAITVFRKMPVALNDKQVTLLNTFADQAVIAIENVRLFNETKEALEQQTATAEILKVISSSPTDVQPVFDAVAERAAHICDAYDSSVVVKEGDRLRLGAIVQRTPGILGALKSGESVALDRDTVMGRSIFDLAVVQVADLQNPPGGDFERGRQLAHRMGHRTTLAVPLLRENEALGAILLRRREVRPFTEKQVALLRTFADQAAIAIENVRLFKELGARSRELAESVKRLTALGEVSQAISSTLDLDKVLQTIVSRAIALTGLDGGSLYEYQAHEQVYHLRAAENVDDSLVELFSNAPIRLGEGAVGRTGMTREPVVVPDVQEESYQSRAREYLIRSGSRALLAVPLLREGHILGALAVTRNTPGPFAPEVVELLKTFATQSALAIQNARLFREIEDKGRQLEEASRHKSQFLASMSHELRTPLNAILGFNEMILGQIYGEVPADMLTPLTDIQTSGKHLLRLINNVLDLAKIEAGRMELALADYSVQDTVESVRSTLRPLAADKGLEFLANVPNDIPLAYGDSGRITQCLMNLAGNSLKFTKAGKVEIAVECRDGRLVYRVADTGIGIPADKMGSLFSEFKQTDATVASEYGGTGLGLSISKKFVEMHGGRIWVESEPGKGSSFFIELPLRAEKRAAA